jgi:hypothetical protein
MGKASSAKKVARAARAGGKSSKRERPKLAFPAAVFAVIVLGTLLVVFGRTTRSNSASADVAPVLNKDHWHAAYGIYVCDHFVAPLQDLPDKPDVNGIHTHGEGVMHIHPFSSAASGTKAKLKVFADQVGLKFTDDSVTTPDGTVYKNGEFKCGDKPAKVSIWRWNADDSLVPTEVFENGFNDIRFRGDRDAYTIAVLPEGSDIVPPRPESVPELDKLTDVDQSQTQTPTQVTVPPGVTIPGQTDPAGAPVTTAAGSPPVTDASGAPVTTPTGATPTTAAGATPTTAAATPTSAAP